MLIIPTCHGQHSILSESIHPSAQARAKTGICQWNGLHSSLNPALLSGLEFSSISVFTRNYYFTQGISNTNIFLQFKLNEFSGSSMILSRDGSKDFAEYIFKLSYGLQLGPHTKMGIGLFGILLDQYQLKNNLHANIQWGITTRISPNLMAGCVLTNPFSILKPAINVPPFHFKTGVNYRIYKGLELLVELQKEGFSDLFTSVGINYLASLNLQCSVGVRTSGPQMSAGILYTLTQKFSISMAMENHPHLGISLSTGIDYHLRK